MNNYIDLLDCTSRPNARNQQNRNDKPMIVQDDLNAKGQCDGIYTKMVTVERSSPMRYTQKLFVLYNGTLMKYIKNS